MQAVRQDEPAERIAATTRPNSAWFTIHPALGISMMDHLYNRLDGAYPGRWRKNFPDAQSIANWEESWAEAFEEDGITTEEVRVAVRLMRKRFGWPPSIAEFIELARPPIDPDAAYHEAVAGLLARKAGRMGEWSHRAIYWAAQEVQYDLLAQGQEQIRARWKKVLAKHMEREHHADIPQPALQLPAPGHTQLERDTARALLAKLKAADIIKQPGAGQQLDWAHNIMARVERNDPTLTRAVVQLAVSALAWAEEPADVNDIDNINKELK